MIFDVAHIGNAFVAHEHGDTAVTVLTVVRNIVAVLSHFMRHLFGEHAGIYAKLHHVAVELLVLSMGVLKGSFKAGHSFDFCYRLIKLFLGNVSVVELIQSNRFSTFGN